MSALGPEGIVVSKQSVDSTDPQAVIESNIGFLNDLFAEYLRPDEVSQDALRSYYVDYYNAQVMNGGFSQFVYNSQWNASAIGYLREGLRAIGAQRHLGLFERAASILDALGPERLETFFESEYFGENEERDFLNRYDDDFYALSDREDLTALNDAWLRRHPALVVLSPDEMRSEVQRRARLVADREQRIASALAKEPRYMKLVRALCHAADQSLSYVTAGDPTHVHQGKPTLAWHFITDRGHHYMVDVDGTAIMFHGESGEPIAQIDAPEHKFGAA